MKLVYTMTKVVLTLSNALEQYYLLDAGDEGSKQYSRIGLT